MIGKWVKNMDKKWERNKKLIIFFLVFVMAVAAIRYYIPPPMTQSVNGLNGEAGVIKGDGTIVPFAVFVNSKELVAGDMIYWKFWLNIKVSSVSGSLVSVRFKLWQKWNGATGDWTAGTEGSGDRPATSPTETWFQVSLPANHEVVVPIKYRDNFYPGVETAANLLPGTTLSENRQSVIRDRRVDVESWMETLADGTYTYTLYCTIVSITWQYTEGGVVKTASIVPSPSEIYYTFTIVKTTAEITATLSGSGSV